MSAPLIQIAVREADGKASLFRVQDEAVQSAEDAIAATREAMPEAKVILASVPSTSEESAENT